VPWSRRPPAAFRQGASGETGWLVAPGDLDALGAAITAALGNPLALRPMGIAGRTLAESQFHGPSSPRSSSPFTGTLRPVFMIPLRAKAELP
jgi:hypothetical protein